MEGELRIVGEKGRFNLLQYAVFVPTTQELDNLRASAVPKMRVDGRCEDVIFFDGVFFEPSLTSIFFAT